MAGTVTAVSISGGESIATVAVNPINNATDWSADAQGRPVLTLTVPAPGDFSFYTLTLMQQRAGPLLRSQHLLLQGTVPLRAGLRAGAAHLSADSRGHPADRLPGQGLPELPQGALRLLGAALSGLAGAFGSRLRRDVHGGAERAGRRLQLHAGSGGRRSHNRYRDAAPLDRAAWRAWWITSRVRRPPLA